MKLSKYAEVFGLPKTFEMLDEKLRSVKSRNNLILAMQDPQDSNIPVEIIEYIFNKIENFDIRQRAFLALDKNCPVETLNNLSNDINPSIREAVAINLKTPKKILEKLTNDNDCDVAQSAYETLERIAARNHKIDIHIENIKLSEEQQRKLFSGDTVEIGATQYKHKDCIVFAKIENFKIKTIYVANKTKQSTNHKLFTIFPRRKNKGLGI